MNQRGIVLTVGAAMVTAGVLIELAGYLDHHHTVASDDSYTPWPRSGGAAVPNSETSPFRLPDQAPTTRPAQATADDPYRAVHYLYRAIANGSATGCAVFSPRAAQQFAAHFGAPDCTAATTQLATQVTHPIEYASTAEQSPDVYPNDTVTISSCEIHPQGGPLLGRFVLKRTDQYRWYIAGHETEECSVLTTGAASTDTRRPGRAHTE